MILFAFFLLSSYKRLTLLEKCESLEKKTKRNAWKLSLKIKRLPTKHVKFNHGEIDDGGPNFRIDLD
jgi:hypothetical protein